MGIRSIAFALVCLIFSVLSTACGNSKTGDRPPQTAGTTQVPTPSPAPNPTPTATPVPIAWNSVFFYRTQYGVPCGNRRVSLANDGTLLVESCNQKSSAKISAVDFNNFETDLQPVLASLYSPSQCTNNHTMDATLSSNVVDNFNRTIEIYGYNIKATCFRGQKADDERIDNDLGQLSQKYLPQQ